MSELLSELSGIDIFLIILLFMSFVRGLTTGFVQMVLGLLNWFLAIVISIRFSVPLAPVVAGWFGWEEPSRLAAILLLFVSCILVGRLVTSLVFSSTREFRYSGLDRLLGGWFGLFRMALILSIFVGFARPVFGDRNWWLDSRLIWSLDRFGQPVVAVLRTLTGYGDGGADKIRSKDTGHRQSSILLKQTLSPLRRGSHWQKTPLGGAF